jgi:hypothetical protein
MKVIGYHISDKSIVDSEGSEFIASGQCFEWLLQPRPDSIRMLYHIEYNVANLLKMARIGKEAGRELLYTTSLITRPYALHYVPGKLFSVKRKSAFAYFSNAGQYINMPNEWLFRDARELALKAQEIGYKALEALRELGVDATSLTNPYMAYEKAPATFKLAEMLEQETDEIKRNVMRKIALGMIEIEMGQAKHNGLISLSVAIKENRWVDLGKINERRKNAGLYT